MPSAFQLICFAVRYHFFSLRNYPRRRKHTVLFACQNKGWSLTFLHVSRNYIARHARLYLCVINTALCGFKSIGINIILGYSHRKKRFDQPLLLMGNPIQHHGQCHTDQIDSRRIFYSGWHVKHSFLNFFRGNAHGFCKNARSKGTAEASNFLKSQIGNHFARPLAVIIVIRRQRRFRAFSRMADRINGIDTKLIQQERTR